MGVFFVDEMLNFIANVSYDSVIYHDTSTEIGDFMVIAGNLFLKYLIIALVLGALGIVVRWLSGRRPT
ncbi:hypothetical protein KDK_58500 [Dictyobacter kobayashii]|uniref:Uncharacterized protein n=1 Tax=Dictyobacter kobayashii TaxID=2014872 RepID=A0A402ASH3_9CHLR|nr:hypothetical protein KDK_58500 [Dictyobacter kobayashii]